MDSFTDCGECAHGICDCLCTSLDFKQKFSFATEAKSFLSILLQLIVPIRSGFWKWSSMKKGVPVEDVSASDFSFLKQRAARCLCRE